MIVADSSAVVAALLGDGPARRSLLGEPPNVPHLVDAEAAQALRRLVRVGELDVAQATAGLATLQRLNIVRHPMHPLLTRVWELRENLSAYDASYVALAEALDCPLVTADARISRAPGLTCAVTVVPR